MSRLDVLTNVLLGRIPEHGVVDSLFKRFNEKERALAILALDRLRQYCQRIVGIASGEVVFDGTPEQLSADAVRRIYGLQAGAAALDEAVTSTTLPLPEVALASRSSAPAASVFTCRTAFGR